MKNDLGALNNYLFEQIERLNDDETLENEDNFDKEIERSKAITGVAKTIIDNAKLLLEAKKYQDEFGNDKNNIVPEMFRIENKK